ncbi:MAG: hypothetical protein U0704_12535 [Candidatus Eisenbacteria bacterium]
MTTTADSRMRPEARHVVRDLPAEHLDDLVFLLAQRDLAVTSHVHFVPHLAALDERIAADLLGLAVTPRHAAPAVEDALGGSDGEVLAAGARAVAHLAQPALWRTFDEALLSAKPAAAVALAHGLVGAPTASVRPRLAAWAELQRAAPPHVAIALGEVAAAHGSAPTAAALAPGFTHDDAAVRAAALRAAQHAGVVAPVLGELAAQDPDPGVREAALLAGLWTRAPWCGGLVTRLLAEPATAPAGCVTLAAAVAEADALPKLRAHAANTALGPARFGWLADAGWSELLPLLLEGLDAPEAADATAAAEAFARLTGVGSPAVRANAAAAGADPVYAPDPARARAHWASDSKRYLPGKRWAQGMALEPGDAPATVDLGAARLARIRARHSGRGSATSRELLRLA